MQSTKLPSLILLIVPLLLSVASACTPSKANRMRSSDEIHTQCSKKGYSCAIADLDSSGRLVGDGEIRFDTLAADECYVVSHPNKYGAGVGECSLCLKNNKSFDVSVSASYPKGAGIGFTVKPGQTRCIKNRSNCAAWCGSTRYTNSRVWSLNTFRRCYGGSTCSRSKCLKEENSWQWWNKNWWY